MTDVLKGVRVVELSTVITAPLTGLMLVDLGADVIKVEPPLGDPFRNFRGESYSPNFVAYNRGKRSIRLDLRTDAGRSVLLELIARADILLENYRPGIMQKLGLTEEVLEAANAKLIHCSITGFGESGPYSARPAYDNVAVALSGILSLQVDPMHPQSSGPTIGRPRAQASSTAWMFNHTSSGSDTGNLLRRVPGRAGPGCSASFRRRDCGLRAVLLSLSASVLTRTVERHSR